jgi:hypothetical protein
VDNNFSSSFKVDSRLAEPRSGSGIWFGERSCVDGDQQHYINAESALDIFRYSDQRKMGKKI